MESFTVTEFGRRTSRVTYAAERAPVQITNRGDTVCVVVGLEDWAEIARKIELFDEQQAILEECVSGSAQPPATPEPRCDGCNSWTGIRLTNEDDDPGLRPNQWLGKCAVHGDESVGGYSCGEFETRKP